jgi:hypothetical protein
MLEDGGKQQTCLKFSKMYCLRLAVPLGQVEVYRCVPCVYVFPDCLLNEEALSRWEGL